MATNNLLETIMGFLSETKDNFETRVKKYDITTDTGYTECMEKLAELRKQAQQYDDTSKKWFGFSIVAKIDEIAAKIMNEHEEAKAAKEMSKVSDYVKPSVDVADAKQDSIRKIVNEYVDTKIRPYVDGSVSERDMNTYTETLFQFACWVLNR